MAERATDKNEKLQLYCFKCDYSKAIPTNKRPPKHCEDCGTLLQVKNLTSQENVQPKCSTCGTIFIHPDVCCNTKCPQFKYQTLELIKGGSLSPGHSVQLSQPSDSANVNTLTFQSKNVLVLPNMATPVHLVGSNEQIPFCGKCNAEQIMQNPKFCCNKSCGQSFTSRKYLLYGRGSTHFSHENSNTEHQFPHCPKCQTPQLIQEPKRCCSQYCGVPFYYDSGRSLTITSEPPNTTTKERTVSRSEGQTAGLSHVEEHKRGVQAYLETNLSHPAGSVHIVKPHTYEPKPNAAASTLSDKLTQNPLLHSSQTQIDKETDSFHSINDESSSDHYCSADEGDTAERDSSSQVKEAQLLTDFSVSKKISTEQATINLKQNTATSSYATVVTGSIQSQSPSAESLKEVALSKESPVDIDWSGLRALKDKSISITFHVIIPKVIWNWDSNSRVQMRFGDKQLGSWNDCQTFTVLSCEDDEVAEMTITFEQFDSRLLEHSRCIPYKYVVHTAHMGNKDECYEYLHLLSNKKEIDHNRCLMIPHDKLVKTMEGGQGYHHYDTIVYPKIMRVVDNSMDTPSKGLTVKGFFKAIAGVFTKQRKDEHVQANRFHPPTALELIKLTLNTFLKPLKSKILAVKSPGEIDFQGIVQSVEQIKTCLLNQNIHDHKQMIPCTQDKAGLNEAIKGWLEGIITELSTGDRNHQLTVVFFVVYSVSKLYPTYQQLKKGFIVSILKMVSLNANCHSSSCEELTFIQDHILTKERLPDKTAIITYLRHFLSQLSLWTDNVDLCIVWLKALPLVHFLTGNSSPFKDIDCSVWTCDDKIGIKTVKERTMNTNRVLKSHRSLQETFQLDPHTLYTFLEICPDHGLLTLCEDLPPYITLSRLAKIAKSKKKLKTDEAQQLMAVIDKTVANFGSLDKLGNRSYQNMLCILKVSQQLLYELFLKLRDKTDPVLEVLLASVKCVLKSAHFLVTISSDNYISKAKKEIACVFVSVYEALKNWIVQTEVIGGSMFGGTVNLTKWKGKSELHVWQKLLKVDLSDVPPTICEEWHKVTRSIIAQRIGEVKTVPKMKLDLFCLMEQESHASAIHPVLEEVIMESIMEAIDYIQTNQAKSIEQLESFGSKRVGLVFGKIFEKKYSAASLAPITVEGLLEWHLWPKFLRVLTDEKKAEIKEGLTEHCFKECESALHYIHYVYKMLHDRSITIKDLRILSGKKPAIIELCVSVLPSLRALEEVSNDLSEVDIQEIIDQRIKELVNFVRVRQELLQLCQQLDSDRKEKHIEGLSPLLEELGKDFDDHRICDVCEKCNNDQVVVTCFQSGRSLSTVASQFTICTKNYGCDIFYLTWREKLLTVLQTSKGFSISDFEQCVWKPTLEHFSSLINSLISLSMTLVDVDKYLKEHSHFQTQVINLLKCVTMCTGNYSDSQSESDLQQAICRAEKYLLLCTYHKGARVFLQLKDMLDLVKGDFSHLTTFSSTSELEGKTLACIDDDLIKSGQFLDDIAHNPKKIECLESFLKCQALVSWLRSNTPNGVKDIHGFVHLALTTSAGGEDDFSQDRLSDLQTVGSGFAPLIYDVIDTDGFQDLKCKCETLWEALKSKPNLPELIVSCTKRLQWYQSVKDTQGDVETTSYGQMRNILKFGRFNIGITTGQPAQSIHNLVHMNLRTKDKDLPQKIYTLDELRDLESKLVLICGDKTDARTEVDHFLNILHSATRIAELILKFQQVGNAECSSNSFEFTCASYAKCGESDVLDEGVAKNLVESLQTYIKRLEEILEDWETTIKEARIKYYELNYFTTFQLHILRKELGRLSVIENDLSQWRIKETILMLLHSTSPYLSESAVLTALHEMVSHSSDLGTETSTTSSDKDIQSDVSSEISESYNIEPVIPTVVDHTPDHGVFNSEVSMRITLDKLTKDQHQILDYITAFYDYTEKFVLKAFQECGFDAEREVIERWCANNAGDDETTSSVSENSIHEDSSSSESEPEDVFNSTMSYSQSGLGNIRPNGKELQYTAAPIQLQRINRNIIKESHPLVQQLTEANYTLEQSIEAVRLHKTLGSALDYLDAKYTSDDDQDEIASGNDELFEANYLENNVEESSENDELVFREFVHEDATSNYLTLDQLGTVLKCIHNQGLTDGKGPPQREFRLSWLHPGQPNLVVTSGENVLSTVLGIYMHMEDTTSALPTFEEVLICNERTTSEEVSLLWHRAIFDPEYKRIFCLVHAERLTFQVCDEALKSLSQLSQGKTGYRVVVVCSKEEKDKSPITSKLHQYKRQDLPQIDKETSNQYLLHNFSSFNSSAPVTKASVVDPEGSCVRVVQSHQSGMGKSLYVQRTVEKLNEKIGSSEVASVTIPLHGPTITPDSVLGFLAHHMEKPKCTIYHLDIAPSILPDVDTILFSLLILRALSDSQGNVWRCHHSQLYLIEITLLETIAQRELQITKLLQLLPTVVCISPCSVLSDSIPSQDSLRISIDAPMFHSLSFQRVYQYLKRYEDGTNLDAFEYKEGSEIGDEKDFINLVVRKCGIKDPTWAEINHFIKFLDIQLESSEKSVFCDQTLVKDVGLSGMKEFVVKFMIQMSQDFSTPSLEGVLNRKNFDQMESMEQLQQYQIALRRKWEHCPHPYLFFNNDGESKTLTFVGFKVNIRCDLMDPTSNEVFEKSFISKELYRGLKAQGVNFQEDYRKWNKLQMIEKVIRVLGLNCEVSEKRDPDPSYVLTSDNLVKILAILMRFRCDIPVVIMGETGCGKTRLIRYMCDLARLEESTFQNMLILKIHGGVTDEKVMKFMERAEHATKRNRQIAKNKKVHCPETVVFFDEANTTDSIDLIKEIMCDRTCNGKPVSKDLKFIAACNPYHQHSKGMIQKLESAGLGFYVRATESQQTLGKIPLRHLVYRVLDLPPSMRALVYDFGQLDTTTEKDYTSQIVKDHAKRYPFITPENALIIAEILAEAQKYMRIQKDECSFVSLRDVERAMIVFEFFVEHMGLFAPLINEKAQAQEDDDVLPNDITRAMILSLSVCYHARLGERSDFEKVVCSSFRNPLELSGGSEQFRNEIKWCQEVLLDSMVLGPNIAKNAALRENVFMMAICIELRIPLFLVGKPGSSKSLAKSIIQDSMHGTDSENALLQHFKQVRLISYQCSQLSTSESVIEVFKTAEKIQSRRNPKQYVSVVVLDEVGLAEDSPNLPLKALHPLLEDGTEGAGKRDEQIIIDREKRVAFVGISNWALDPAKMNRGVMVTRGSPGLEELITSANGICSNVSDDPIKQILQPYIKPLSEAYMEIIKNQESKEFFGLRDFYSLIKMLYWMCYKSESRRLTWFQLEHAIKRNFGGSPNVNTFKIFEKAIGFGRKDLDDYSDVPKEMLCIVKPDCSNRALIKASLNTKDATWHGENRYLLFLTENYAALNVLEHYLNIEDLSETEQVLSKPFILFGSSFPKDKDYTQVCRNINRIKICMETGRAVILLNLEHLYESLYDVLNQYYMYSGGNRYVDLGLQTHRMKCRVHKNFKLILIAEKSTVYKTFPTPLINRLEKHFVLASSVLENWQLEVLQRLKEWIKVFSHTSYSNESQHFREGHAFIGYQQDTAAAVTFQASNLLSKVVKDQSIYFPFWRACSKFVLGSSSSTEQLKLSKEGSEEWKEVIFRMSQFLLLETASDESLARLYVSKLDENEIQILCDVYYKFQQHDSIGNFLKDVTLEGANMGQQQFIQVTTRARLLTHEEIVGLSSEVGIPISHFDLHEFATELDFSSKISSKFAQEEETSLIILQCDSGQENYDLIACARYRIYDESVKAQSKNRIQQTTGTTHVLFIINLLSQNITSQFVGFQCDPWISVHIDDLRPTTTATIDPSEARHLSISELFIGRCDVMFNSSSFMANDNTVQVSLGTVSSKTQPQIIDDGIIKENETDSPSQSSSLNSNSLELNKSLHLLFEEQAAVSASCSESSEGGSLDQLSITSSPPHQDSESEMAEETSAQSRENTFKLAENKTVMIGRQKANDSVSTQSELPTSQFQAPPSDISESLVQPAKPAITPQHWRLYNCIQAAVSAITDHNGLKSRARLRISKLTKLVPHTIQKLDDTTFYSILVSHVHSVLKRRERNLVYQKDWVGTEARDPKRLQNGGTFRNVLSRRIDEVVTPIFSEIIAKMDQNCNLDLIDEQKCESALSSLWLLIFKSIRMDTLTSLHKNTAVNIKFKSQFPFSWLIYCSIEAVWTTVDSGMEYREVVLQLSNSLCQTDIGRPLQIIFDEENCCLFYHFYLHDFVRTVYQSKYGKDIEAKEYELVTAALNGVAQSGLENSDQGSLANRISSIHVAYKQYESEFLWFNELVHHNPSIVQYLSPSGLEMDLHLLATSEVLNSLKPPLNSDNPGENFQWWLNHVRISQSVINSVLNLDSQNEDVLNLRANWQRIQVLRMFVEHVLLPHSDIEGIIIFARRLNLRLSDEKSPPDFHTKETLLSVKKLIVAMDKDKKIKSLGSSKRGLIRTSCRNFFMEVISNLCFGHTNPPEDQLISFVMDIILAKNGTRNLSPYKDSDVDKSPTIRSFLLQLLLDHNTEQVKKSLDEYFIRSKQVADPNLDQGLCLLCIQCFEDSLVKVSLKSSHSKQIQHLEQCLRAGYNGLVKHFQLEGDTSLQYLEAVANIRFALVLIADRLRHDPRSLDGDLLQRTIEVCTDMAINKLDPSHTTLITGPILFLLKVLIRHYGFSFLMSISKTHQWIVPETYKIETHCMIDTFIIYQEQYSRFRNAVKVAMYEDQLNDLDSVTQITHCQRDPLQTALLVVSIYQQVTLMYSKDLPQNHPFPMVKDKLNDFVVKSQFLSDDLKILARLLIHNKQAGPLAQMTVSPRQSNEDQLLTSIVIHSVSIVLSHSNKNILLPFVNVISNPTALADAYLPTMKENLLQEFKDVLRTSVDYSAAFYECENGHPYLIGNCGRPWVTDNCNVCGAIIGGTVHKLKSGKKAIIDVDTTRKGYDLEHPSQRTTSYEGERDLPASAVCIVRAIMHSCFVWATCSKGENLEAVASIITFRITAQELPEFFWRSLATDLQDMSNILKRGMDECAMVLHLVLRQIQITNVEPNGSVLHIDMLKSKQARKDWERTFNELYIEPVMKSLPINLKKAMDIIGNDDQQDHDKLFHLAYENVRGDEKVLNSHIWALRPRITTEHLRAHIRKKETVKILYAFLDVEQTLRATQYLPDIMKLQYYLFTRFNRRLDKSKARRQKVKEFLQEEKKENSGIELSVLMESLKKAWDIVGHTLCHYNLLPVTEKFLPQAITDDTEMIYIIPTTIDEGRCTTALVHFLVHLHNEFINKCRSILNNGSSQNDLWRVYKVQITQIERCHFIQHEQHLQSIILSHCHYSLTVGKGHEVKYDLPALEKHILNRFIYGKPTIKLDKLSIPNVAYCKDIYTAETFRAIREKVHPQVPLLHVTQRSIIMELRTPERLRESLDVVDIVLGLLSSGGGSANVPLKKYLDTHRMKKRPFSTKAKDMECTLGNIISLWETLSVELARQLWLVGQEPFESVPVTFTKDISTQEVAELDKCLMKFDLGLILGSLYEFIEVHVKNASDNEEEWELVEALNIYRDMTEQDDLPNLQEFPKCINVSKAIATWKHIVHYQTKCS